MTLHAQTRAHTSASRALAVSVDGRIPNGKARFLAKVPGDRVSASRFLTRAPVLTRLTRPRPHVSGTASVVTDATFEAEVLKSDVPVLVALLGALVTVRAAYRASDRSAGGGVRRKLKAVRARSPLPAPRLPRFPRVSSPSRLQWLVKRSAASR